MAAAPLLCLAAMPTVASAQSSACSAIQSGILDFTATATYGGSTTWSGGRFSFATGTGTAIRNSAWSNTSQFSDTIYAPDATASYSFAAGETVTVTFNVTSYSSANSNTINLRLETGSGSSSFAPVVQNISGDGTYTLTYTFASDTAMVGVTTRETNNGPAATILVDASCSGGAPTVSSVSPDSGPASGNALVTVNGSNLTGATSVTFGGTPGTGITVAGDGNSLSVTTPAHAAGAVAVAVTTPGGSDSLANGYTYLAAPTATSISPTSGPASGGTIATITGTGFVAGATSVTIGGTTLPAGSVTVAGATSLSFTTPAQSAGNVAVTVTTGGGTSGAVPGGFTYIPAPTVTGLSPAFGSTAGGNTVTITGTDLSGATGVQFGGTAASGVTVVSATQITATVPGPASAGTVNVTVTTPGGTSGTGAASQYEYRAPPAVAVSSPADGGTASSTSPTYSGTVASGSTVEVHVDGASIGAATVAGSSWSLAQPTPLAPGSHTVYAVATLNGVPNTSPTSSFTVKQDQTIAFNSAAPTTAQYNTGNYTVTATATSGLPVTLTIDPAATSYCSIAGNVVTYTGVGTCVINANQSGDASYYAAPQAQQSFAIAPASQTITFGAAPASPTVGGSYAPSATATSGLPVTFSIDAGSTSGACSIAGATVSFTGAGTCIVNGNQSGNTNYAAAPQAQQSFTIAATAPGAPTIGTATAGDGQATVSFAAPASNGGAAITGYTVTASPGGATASGSGSPITVTGLTNGQAYTFTVTATNAQGTGPASAASNAVTPQPAPPIAGAYSTTAPYNPGSAAPQSFSLSAQVTGGSPTGYAVGSATTSGGGSVSIDSSGQVSYTPPAGYRGNDSFTYTASNGGGTSAPATVTVLVGDPTLTIGLAGSGTVDTALTGVTVTASGGTAPYSCALAGGTLPGLTLNSNCTITGTPSTAGNHAFTVTVTDSSAGPAGAFSQLSNTLTLSIAARASSVSLTSAPNPSTFGQTVTATATITGTSPSGSVTFSIGGSPIAGCASVAVAGGSASCSYTPATAGTFAVDAAYSGDANNAPSSGSANQSVTQASQTVSFTSTPPAPAVFGGTYTPSATATSGLAVSFAIDATSGAVCTIAGGTVSFTGAGTCTINANQPGNVNYSAAPQAQQTVTVTQANQTIGFTSTPPSPASFGGTYTPTATATSGLAVSFTIDPAAGAVCAIAGGTVSFTGVGTCTINANQAGNANFSAAPQVQQTITVAQASQTIGFTSTPPSPANFGGTYTPAATATSGLAVTFTIDPAASGVCSIAGGTVTFTGAGTCTINANQAGNANYGAAPQAQQSFAVGQTSQTIAFTSTPPSPAAFGGTYTPSATATSGLAVTFTIDPATGGVCTIAGGTVTFTGAGACTINANQAGNANYSAAPQVQQTVTVAQASQTISFTSTPPSPALFGGTYAPSATATSGLAVSFTIDPAASGVCTIAGGTVSFTGAGTCTINANQPGNANYGAAPQAQQSFAVGEASQTIAFTSAPPSAAVFGGTYAPTATATSGLAVTFTIDPAASGVCSIAGGTVSFTGTGTCTVNADQAGNSNYTAAPRVQQSFAVGQASQAVSFTSTPPSSATPGSTYVPAATATSGLAVVFTIDPASSAVCTISGGTVRFTDAGTCTVNADQPGNANYGAAPRVQQAITVGYPAPVVAGASATVPYNSSGTAIDLSASISGVHSSIAVASAPAHGTASVSGNVVTYTPTAGYYGADSFTYTASGPGGTSAPATVSVTVATPAAPSVVDASANVPYNSTGTAIDLSASISGVHSSIAVASAPAHGTASVSGNVVTYTPTAGYYGADSFTYTASGPGGTSTPATVTLTVAVPAPPTVADRSDVAVEYNSAGTAIDLAGSISGVYTSVAIASAPAHGTATITGTVVTYVPTAGHWGADSFAYTASGPGGTSTAATVGLTVAAPPPPVAQPGSETVTGNTPVDPNGSVQIDLSALVSGQYDTIRIDTPPAHGTVTLQSTGAGSAGSGTRALAVATVIATYTPAVGYVGTDSFTFVAVGPGGTSSPAAVTVEVVGAAPVASPHSAATGDGQTVSVDLTAGAANGPFTAANIVAVTPAAAATATIVTTGSGSTQGYRLDVTAANRFGGTISVQYTLSNAYGTSAPATVTVTVSARPDPTTDPNVRGISDAQAEATRRFARSQVSNFMRRTEQLHNGGGSGGSAMGVTLNSRDGGAFPQAMPGTDDSALAITQRMRMSEEDPAIGAYLNSPAGRYDRGGMLNRPDSLLGTSSVGVAPAESNGQAGEEPGYGADAGPGDGRRQPGSVAVWSGGAIDIGTQDATRDRSKITATTTGLSGGADIMLAEGAVLGIGGGYGNDVSWIGGSAARVRSQSSLFAAYASLTPFEGAFVDGMAGVGDLSFSTRRTVEETRGVALGSRDGAFTVAALALGIDRGGGSIRWSIYGRGEIMNADLDAYVESGAGRYDLRFDARSLDSLTGTLGARIEAEQRFGDLSVQPRLRFEWSHEFQDADPQWLDYADIPGAAFYSLATRNWTRDQYQLTVGSRFLLLSGWGLDFETGARFGSGMTAGTLRMLLSKRF
ncbi:Ig-like domain-containing protein [Sphingosinithalassobacter sp. CS137]|uniref:Ig-like domain-containing protein n=1 Tax=Sphingosinithalassobacter sp. CS137 TaxID=2762748 RepID=UPI00165D8543|nr:Ig-like domain-containing protein [Sphingosinithalassobacter sp. CS137]